MNSIYITSVLRGVSFGLSMPIWVSYLINNNITLLQIGILGTLFEMTKFIFEIPFGSISDKKGEGFSIKTYAILSPIAFLMLGLSESMVELSISMVLWGMAESFYSGSFQSWAIKTSKDSPTKILLKCNIVLIIMVVVFSLITTIINKENHGYLILVAGLLQMPIFFIAPSKAHTSLVNDSSYMMIVKDAISASLHSGVAIRIGIASLVGGFAIDGFDRFWQPLIDIKVSDDNILGYIFAATAIISLVLVTLGSKISHILEENPLRSLFVIDMSSSILAIICVASSPLGIIISIIILLSIDDLRTPLLQAYSSSFPSENKSTLISINSGFGAFGEIVSGIVLGMIASSYGVNSVFLVCGIIMSLMAITYVIGSNGKR